MKVGFKRVLIGLALVVAIALGGLAIFLLTFDPNAYKGKFEELVYERYHRTLSIDGDIELSMFPRIGLSVQNVSLSNRDSQDTFASIDSARFAVAIWPLLFNRFVVDHVAVSGFKAWVTRDQDGQFNFHDLMEGPPGPPQPIALEPSPGFIRQANAQPVADGAIRPADLHRDAALQIDIAGLDLQGGEIHFVDARHGYVARLVKLQVNTGRMTFDQPFDVAVRGTLLGEYPQADATLEGQAQVKMDPLQKNYSAQKLNVQVAGLLGMLDARTATLRGNFVYSGYSHMVDASGVELLLQGGTRGPRQIRDLDASLSLPRLKIDRSRSEFVMEKLALRAKGNLPEQGFELAFDAPQLSISPEEAKGETVAGTVKLSGEKTLALTLGMSGLGGDAWNLTAKELKMDSSLKNGDHTMQISMSSPAQWDVFNEKGTLSAIKGDVKIEDTALPGGSFEFPLIGSVHADLIKDEVASEINAVLNGAPLNFNMKATELASPKLRFALQADVLDFDKLFPAPKPAPEPAPQAAEPEQKAQPDPQDEPAVSPAAPAAEPAAFDLTALDSMDLAGTVKVGRLKVRDLEARNFALSVTAAKGKLDLYGLSANLYDGTLTGKLGADSQNRYMAQLDLKDVAVGPLMRGLTGQERLAGVGGVKLDLKAQGATAEALRAGLAGSARMQLRDGTIRGIDLGRTLSEAVGVLHTVMDGRSPEMPGQFDLARQTDFSSLDADLAVANGVATFRKLDVKAPLLRVTQGKPAAIDVADGKIDLVANVRVVNTVKGQNDAGLAELRGLTVPVHLAGELRAPSYSVQWKDMGGRLVQAAMQRGLLDFATRQLERNKAAPVAAPAPPPAASRPADTVKSLGKALKGLLGNKVEE